MSRVPSIAAVLLVLCSAPTLSAQQGITFQLSGGQASGTNRSGQPSSIRFEIVGRHTLVWNPRPGASDSSLVLAMLADLRNLGYGTTVLGVSEGWVHPEDWRFPLFTNGVLFASDDTGLGLGAGFRAAVIPSSSTKSNGIAVPPARPGAIASRLTILSLQVESVDAAGTHTSTSIPIPIRAGSDAAAIDAAVHGALVAAGLVVNAIEVRSLLQPGVNLSSAGIDRTIADAQVVSVSFSPTFASSGLFDLETAAAWLPTSGFTEYGRGFSGSLASEPLLVGSGSPGVGQRYEATCAFFRRGLPAALVVGPGRAELPLLGAELIVALPAFAILPGFTDVAGELGFAFDVPSDPAFGGLQVFHQGIALTGPNEIVATQGLYAALAG